MAKGEGPPPCLRSAAGAADNGPRRQPGVGGRRGFCQAEHDLGPESYGCQAQCGRLLVVRVSNHSTKGNAELAR